MEAELRSLLFLAAAGFAQAVFALPVRRFRGWRWEQVWTAQSITANVLFPLVWAALASGAFWTQVSRIPDPRWFASYCYGLIWGIGGITYGLTLARLGMAFANSFIFGVTIITGALVPLALNVVEQPRHPWRFAAGLILCLAATVLIGVFRGRGRQEPLLMLPVSLRSYKAVVLIAAISGISSAGYGLAFSFSFGTLRRLVAEGVSPLNASLIIVLPVYLGAASVAIPVGLIFARRSRSTHLFLHKQAARNWSLAIVMGGCAAATVLFYGIGGTGAGHPSPNISFCIFMSFLVLGGNVLGFLSGEMQGNSAAVNAGQFASASGLVLSAWLLNAR